MTLWKIFGKDFIFDKFGELLLFLLSCSGSSAQPKSSSLSSHDHRYRHYRHHQDLVSTSIHGTLTPLIAETDELSNPSPPTTITATTPVILSSQIRCFSGPSCTSAIQHRALPTLLLSPVALKQAAQRHSLVVGASGSNNSCNRSSKANNHSNNKQHQIARLSLPVRPLSVYVGSSSSSSGTVSPNSDRVPPLTPVSLRYDITPCRGSLHHSNSLSTGHRNHPRCYHPSTAPTTPLAPLPPPRRTKASPLVARTRINGTVTVPSPLHHDFSTLLTNGVNDDSVPSSNDSMQSFSPSMASSNSGGTGSGAAAGGNHHYSPNTGDSTFGVQQLPATYYYAVGTIGTSGGRSNVGDGGGGTSIRAAPVFPFHQQQSSCRTPIMGIAEGSALTTMSPTAALAPGPAAVAGAGGTAAVAGIAHNGRSGTIGPATGAMAIAQLNANQQHHGFTMRMNTTAGGDGGCMSNGDEVKPRSLRFTWSMKTTSSLAPEEMMKFVSFMGPNFWLLIFKFLSFLCVFANLCICK